jgi:hypothetical protein
MTMRFCWQVFAVALVFFAAPSVAEPFGGSRLSEHVQDFRQYPDLATSALTSALPLILVSDNTKREPDAVMFALMSGRCSTLKVAGHDFRCRAVAFFQNEEGRGNFVVALDDPNDGSHIVTFSGDNGRRPVDNLYELPIDQMLLKSKDRPKVDGLPVPFVELSAGICRQIGSFATKQVSSISCTATDMNGKDYVLQFVSDGSPIAVRRIRRTRAGRPAISPFD